MGRWTSPGMTRKWCGSSSTSRWSCCRRRNCERRVSEPDREEGLLWLGRADLAQPYVLVMRGEEAEKLCIECVSDLVRLSDLKMDMEDQFFIRPDGYGALKRTYGLPFPRSRIATTFSGMALLLSAQGEVDVAVVPSTEPLLAQEGLRMLVDDAEALPASRLGIVAREEVVSERGQAPGADRGLFGACPHRGRVGSSLPVRQPGESPEDVVADYLGMKPQERR